MDARLPFVGHKTGPILQVTDLKTLLIATMINHLSDLIQGLEHWGYVIVFLIVLLECQVFLGLFMPGESMVMVAGFLAGQGILDIRLLIGVTAAAAVVGDSIGYEFGRLLGRDWLRRHGATFWLRPERLDRMDIFFARHGGLSVLFAHFLHVGRALMPFLAGASRLPYLRFLVYNATGCFLWATIFSLVGYLFGQNWHLVERWIGRASIFAGIVLGMVLAVIWLWRWIASREMEIRRWWEQFCARSGVANLRLRFARHIDWLEQRLSPKGYLGIHLTIGIFLLLAAMAIFGGAFRAFGLRDLLASTDLQVAHWFESHATPVANRAMFFAAHLSSVVWLTALGLFAAAVLIWHREKDRLLLLFLAGPVGVGLDFFLKQLFARERPGFGDEFVGRTGGLLHGDMLSGTVVYGVLAYILMRRALRWRSRALLILSTILVLFVIALSSLYLGAYYLSDALIAMIEGAVWLFFCISGVEIVCWRAQAHRVALAPGAGV
jgi:membrane protein DedA with SNARE-associated domain